MINVFVDADDTILNSSEVVIEILNNRYNINPPKTFEDLKDWHYHSICGKVTEEEIAKIFDSEEFFDKVNIKEDFKKIYEDYSDHFNFIVVTKGTWINLERKKEFFKKNLPNVEVVCLPRYYETGSMSKSNVNMKGGIQIDDVTDALDTNAQIKIILKNDRDFYWNTEVYNVEGNVYIANNWSEVKTYLDYTVKNPEWMNY